VITSPPYGVEAISYLRTHLLSYRCLRAFLGTDPYKFGERVIGSEFVNGNTPRVPDSALAGISPTFYAFFEGLRPVRSLEARTTMMMGFFVDMAEVARSLARWVREGGQMAIVIGNNKIGEAVVPADRVLTEILEANGFMPEKCIKHKLKSNNSNSQVPWQNRVISDEAIMIFRRS
jgi:hypothetical protein